jgi:catechol 2,3-dioxygenase-like lactoylglutathione lyase family enzyme
VGLACACGNGAKDKDPPASAPLAGSTQPAAGSSGGGAPAAAGAGGVSGSSSMPLGDAGAGSDAGEPLRDAGMADADAALPPAGIDGIDCTPRTLTGDATLHFHHVHFNTAHADQDLELFEKLFGTETIEWCKDKQTGEATWATKTDRGYFLYSEVAVAPDPTLNTYLEHVGWLHPNPNMELLRLVALDAPLYPPIRAQCPEASMGQIACGVGGYWLYLQAPSGARIEVALGPGPATSGFGHVHMIMGADLTWLETVTNGAFRDDAIDMVNHTVVALEESILANETVVETRGKPIDHIAYSTTALEAERDRLLAAGIALAEDITWKPSYGFRSFFLKDAKGIWYEIVEDTAF